MKTIAAYIENYVAEARDDLVGLWQIASSLKDDDSRLSAEEIKTQTFEIAKGLIERGVVPGNMVKGNDFHFWQGNNNELLEQIETTWPKTGIPDLTNPCWFCRKA